METNDLGIVDGHHVVERAPATWRSGITGNVTSKVSTVDEVLLDDGRVRFVCVYPDTACEYHDQTVRSVIAHQRAHSAKIVLRKQRAERAERAATTAANRRISSENQQQRLAEISRVGVAQTLRDVADMYVEAARTLRLAARLVRAEDVDAVSPEELAQLRVDSAALQQLRSVLNRGGK